LTTKIHALVDALGNPANLMLTAGQVHDLACAQDLIENADPEALIGDKAYDADPLIDTLARREITPVIPPKTNRKIKRECDFVLYRERNLIERFFNKLKQLGASPPDTTSSAPPSSHSSNSPPCESGSDQLSPRPSALSHGR
jgi:transposase